MKTVFVSIATIAVLGAVPAGALADYYATKADYRAGKLTPGEKASRDGSDDCNSPPDMGCPIIFGDPFTDTGDTTGATSTIDTIPSACNGNYSTVAGPDHLYTFIDGQPGQIGSIWGFQVTTTDDDYDLSIYILSACGDGKTCVIGADDCLARSAIDNPCGPVSDEEIIPVSFVSPGAYFFVVDSFYAPGNPDGRDSGPYTLSVIGPCPVELLKFWVE